MGVWPVGADGDARGEECVFREFTDKLAACRYDYLRRTAGRATRIGQASCLSYGFGLVKLVIATL